LKFGRILSLQQLQELLISSFLSCFLHVLRRRPPPFWTKNVDAFSGNRLIDDERSTGFAVIIVKVDRR
jgi:hypothetical protein